MIMAFHNVFYKYEMIILIGKEQEIIPYDKYEESEE